MNIAKHTVVRFDYTLKDESGEAMESSQESGPMAYLHGADNIIPGLESAMEGRTEGDEFEVTVPPEEAYGERQDGLVQRVSLKRLGIRKRLQPGQVLRVPTEQGPQMVRVIRCGRFHADLDGNHPQAGRSLTFAVSIREVREATDEEKSHGHVHEQGEHCESE